MARTTRKRQRSHWPAIRSGDWKGEIIRGGSAGLGQEVQPWSPPQSVEFSYLALPATFYMPENSFPWPGVVAIMLPSPKKAEPADAGTLTKSEKLPSLTLSLEVTRAQFSDMLPLLDAGRFRDFHFSIGDGTNNTWPVRSWGMTTRFLAGSYSAPINSD